jgi:hypothetical protein
VSCRRVRDWLHVDSPTLDEAQRLILDDHLAACERCRGDRERLRLVHQLGSSIQPSIDPRDINRAIARALIEGAPRREPAPVRRTWVLAIAGVALAVAAGAVIVIGARDSDAPTDVARPEPPRQPEPSRPSPPHEAPAARALADDVVAAGTVHVGDRTIAAGGEVPAGTVLTGDATLRLRDAQVVLGASTQIVWLPTDRALLLEAGSVEVSVDGAELRVRVGAIAIAIAGGAATVSSGRIEVRRGAARIMGRDGRVITSLTAGQVWTPAVASVEKPRTNQPAKTPTLAELLRLAEQAQSEGMLELAIERYTAVATTFAGAPQAESALYAAARLELRLGRTSRARSLLDTYLSRYPRGRYVEDVRRELLLIR